MGNALRALNSDEIASDGPLDAAVFCRLAADNGATRTELIKDIGALVSQKLSPSELRGMLDAALDAALASGQVTASRNRFQLAPPGLEIAKAHLGCQNVPNDWATIRDVRLVATALGLSDIGDRRAKQLARPDGLRAAILQQAYQLSPRKCGSPAKLRSALAAIALERAFGNKLKSEFSSGKGLSARAGRVLAGQLARKPRDFGTDTRLIGALAAEACGSAQTDAASLRLAILRNAFGRRIDTALGKTKPQQQPRKADVPAAGTPPVSKPAAATRPDLPGFAKAVKAAAKQHGEGWPGNMKAFISHVWGSIQSNHPEWGVTEIEFKAMLAEAHRTGHIVLANADLRSKDKAKDVQESAINYKNTVWHYVRVDD
ncbi:MAG: hypothetical protein AAF346_07195 [Pseudomonadota bacterium]